MVAEDGREGVVLESEPERVRVQFADGQIEWLPLSGVTEKASETVALKREIGS